ncbi:hypothetical protein ACI2LM_13350 [Paenibacillus lautus]|uniref:hypothetical protein n=1 Tax=Paenibacillus lautus TaxID=1401 RepID=UPI00384C3BAD
MSRDWQKDRQYLETVNEWESGIGEEDIDYLCEIATHYHQQYAAEKERGDKAEIAHKELKEYFDIKQQQVWLLSEELNVVRAREKKLREAVDDLLSIFNHEGSWRSVEVSDGFVYALWESDSEKIKSVENMLDSLYPKEGEA